MPLFAAPARRELPSAATGECPMAPVNLATFRRKNALSDVGRLTSCAADMVLGGDFALVHSRARGELTVPA